jgi:hypothetical protein
METLWHAEHVPDSPSGSGKEVIEYSIITFFKAGGFKVDHYLFH